MFLQIWHKMDHCSCSFRTFGPVFLQIPHKMDHCSCSFRTWGDQSSCSFSHVRKLQQHWWDQSSCSFRTPRVCVKTATTLVDQSSCCFRTSRAGGTILLAVFAHPGLGGPVFLQFSHIRGRGDQSSCSFRTSRAGGNSLLAVFAHPGPWGPASIIDARN